MTQPTQAHAELLNTDFVGDEFIEKLVAAYNEEGLLAHIFNEEAGVIPGNAFTIKYLSDNGYKADDLAVAEIQGRFNDYGPEIAALSKRSQPTVQYNNTPYQDSIGGAYDLAQISRDSKRGIGTVVFLNCAPRKKQRGAHDNNQGEEVFIGMLKDGTVIGATGEESFTFFRDLLDKGELELYKANVQTNGSQFRSRDYWPLYTQVLTHQLRQLADQGEWKPNLNVEERKAFLSKLNVIDTDTKINLDYVPKPSDAPVVVRYDVHENLKLNVRASDYPEGTFIDQQTGEPKEVAVTINGVTETMTLGKSMFKKGAGKLSFSEGSTGSWSDYSYPNLKEEFKDVANPQGLEWTLDPNGFLQIAVINGSAKAHFKVTDAQLRSDAGVAVRVQSLEEYAHGQDLKFAQNGHAGKLEHHG